MIFSKYGALLASVAACLSLVAHPARAGDAALTLRDCLDLAARANKSLQTARLQRGVAQADIRIASQWANPELSADYIHETPHPTLMLSQPLPLWGKRSAAIDLARREAGVVDLDIEAVEQQLCHDVRLHYYGLLLGQRLEEIGRKDADNRLQLLDVARERLKAEDVAELDVKQAKLEADRADAALHALATEVTTARAQLNLDLGRTKEAPLDLSGSLDDREPVPDIETLVRRSREEGREARELRQRRAAEQARLRLARKGRYPDVSAGIGVELNDPDLGSAPQFGLSVTLPVWSRQAGERAKAEAGLSLLAAEEEALALRLATNLAVALTNLQEADRQVTLYSSSLLPSAREVRELYAESYRQGAVGLVMVLDAERSEREVEIDYARALMDFHAAGAELALEAGLELNDASDNK